MSKIDGQSNNQFAETGQPDALGQRKRLTLGSSYSYDSGPFQPRKNDKLLMCDSYLRPGVLWNEMVREPDHHNRMALFLTYWPCCDAPWRWRSYLAEELRYTLMYVSLAECLPEKVRECFNSLPPEIEIYRGCQRYRERGLSWTVDLEVAQGFAIGKRCRNSVPTIVSALIPKEHVFGIFADRNESEITVDPRRLRRIRHLELHRETQGTE
jgi:hypothetical protein